VWKLCAFDIVYRKRQGDRFLLKENLSLRDSKEIKLAAAGRYPTRDDPAIDGVARLDKPSSGSDQRYVNFISFKPERNCLRYPLSGGFGLLPHAPIKVGLGFGVVWGFTSHTVRSL
jgi:hypothetical protein